MKELFKAAVSYLSVCCILFSAAVSAQTIQGTFESKYKRYKINESFAGTTSQNWNTLAWKGDRLYKQILLWSASNLSGLSYTISNLTKGSDQIGASNVKLRFEKYIKGDPEARGCSEYPTHPTAVEIADALSESTISSISSTDPLKIWLTIDVPNTTVPGIYKGTITVNGAASPLVFNIEINVVNYSLPDPQNWNFHLDLWQFPLAIVDLHNNEFKTPNDDIAYWSDAHFALIEPGYRKLADCGQKAITTYIKEGALGGASMVKWTKKTDGSWVFDYTVFDKYVNTLSLWGISQQINCFSPIGWNKDVIPYWDEATSKQLELAAPLGSTVFNDRWNHFLTDFKSHLDNKGWFNKTVLFMDEVPEAELTPVINMILANNTTWKIGLAHTTAISSSLSNSLYEASGILPYASAASRTGKLTTFYTSCTQTIPNNYVSAQNSAAEMSWMGWHSIKENYNGYLRWAFDNWQLSDPTDARDGAHTAGDFHMIYRSANATPLSYLSSIRLELLRDGIQDYEKVSILKAALSNSADPFDREALTLLNETIAQFGKGSGLGAATLLPKAQQTLSDILSGTLPSCKVYGGATELYYVKSLSATNGSSNINYSSAAFPQMGYVHYTNSALSALPGATFNLNLVNSPASNCARTKVWIDWNNDDDFDDLGEEVASLGSYQSCSNALNYMIPVTVPANSTAGQLCRIRIQVRYSSDPDPVSCGTNDKTGTADFDLQILDPYCQVQGGSYDEYYLAALSSQGGDPTNINFFASGYPMGGYEHHSGTSLSVTAASNFSLTLNNSTASKCARTKVWIDWNGNMNFGDAGEEVFAAGAASSCTNPLVNTFNVTVPPGTALGAKRIRVQLRDSYEPLPTACGTNNFTSTSDFDLKIVSGSGIVNYCPVAGGAYTAYYTKNVNTSSGVSNLNFSTLSYPTNGYERHTTTKVSGAAGSSFTLNITNSPESNCARTKVWVDWNRDGDFDDASEEVFYGNQASSCNNLTSYSIPITIPATAAVGLSRIRIQLKDAWLAAPLSCGTANYSSTSDFDLEVTPISSNQLPTVGISSPANDSHYDTLQNIAINATATDADGTVSEVEFFVNGTSIGVDTTPPFGINWQIPSWGSYQLMAKAKDNLQGIGNSATILVTATDTTAPSCQQLSNENFENGWGIWNDGGTDALRTASNASSGSYSITLRDDTNSSIMTSNNIDLSTYANAKVSLSFITASMEANESFSLELSTNGGSSFTTIKEWKSGLDFTNGQRKNLTIDVTGFSLTANTKFRFRCNASADDDEVFIDDVIIQGCSSMTSKKAKVGFIEEFKTDDVISIYPNPLQSNLLYVKAEKFINKPVSVSITDMNGGKILEEKKQFTHDFGISVPNVPKGIYMLKIVSEGQTFTRKVMIDRGINH